jgi:hypothetical protein
VFPRTLVVYKFSMTGSCNSLAREVSVCFGDLDSCWSSSVDGFFFLARETGKGSTLAWGSTVELSISSCYVSSSYSSTPKSFLEISFLSCVPTWSENSVSRVFLASCSPSWGFGIKASEAKVGVSPGSSSSVIGTTIMRETYELSS